MRATLLVDPISRINCVIDIAELKRFNINIASELKELLNTDCAGHPVILLDGFVQTGSGVSELILFKRMMGLKYIFISKNEVLLRQMQQYAKTFCFDADNIGCSLILAAINDDEEACKVFASEPSNKYKTLAGMILDNSGLVDQTLKDMASYLLNLIKDNERLHFQLSDWKSKYELAHKMNESKANQQKYLNGLLDTMLRQTINVNDALSKYSFLCEKDVYKKVSLTDFKSRPHIIYLKEYGDFLHLNTFVYTLSEVLKRQYDIPVKVLWVLDKNNPLRLKFVPNYYAIFASGVYSKVLVNVSDYMCTTSGYDGIIQTICENRSDTEYLIIVDSKLVDDTIVAVSDILRYDLCRSAAKIGAFGLLNDRTIVNGEEERELSWNHLYDYENLSPEDRFLYLSNRPVITSIIATAQRKFSLE